MEYVMPLNDLQCRTAKPKEKIYKLFDFQGLYLEILPTGAKYWRLKYRYLKKEKRIALGVYPATSLLEARQKKDAVKVILKDGHDPVLFKREENQTAIFRNAQTLETIAREWFLKRQPEWSDRYAQTLLYRLEKYAFPELGMYPITDLKPKVILSCLQKIEATAPEMARRIKNIISEVFKYAIVTDRAEQDYTHGLEVALKRYKKGHFASIDIDELPDLLKALNSYQARAYPQTYLALRLMLLTFVRTSELINAKWTEIDFENKLWKIPAERMKMKRPHLVPLSTQAIDILLELKNLNGKREHIFPSIPRPKLPMSKGTLLVALKRMGFSRKMTGHGFRALAMGIIKEKLNFPNHVIEKQLAHVVGNSTSQAYDRAEYLNQRTIMMQHFADYIQNKAI